MPAPNRCDQISTGNMSLGDLECIRYSPVSLWIWTALWKDTLKLYEGELSLVRVSPEPRTACHTGTPSRCTHYLSTAISMKFLRNYVPTVANELFLPKYLRCWLSDLHCTNERCENMHSIKWITYLAILTGLSRYTRIHIRQRQFILLLGHRFRSYLGMTFMSLPGPESREEL